MDYFFPTTRKCLIAVNKHLGKPAKSDYLACDAGQLWQPYYAWNSGRTHRVDKRPPYFKFKTAYKTRLNDTNNWLSEKILNKKKWSDFACCDVIFP